MSTVQPNYLFLNTVQGTGLDVTVAEGIVVFGNTATANVSPSIKLKNISSIYTKTPGAAANGSRATFTVPASVAAGDDFAFQVSYQGSNGQYISQYVSYEAVTGDTTGIVRDKLKEVLDALVASGSLDAAISTPAADSVRVSGTATNPYITGQVLSNLTYAFVAGNEAFGVGSDLIADGITGISAQPVSTNTYSLAIINYYAEANSLNAQKRDIEQQLYVYVNDAVAADRAAFFTAGIAAKLTTITVLLDAGKAASVEALP
jgi:hypothetical protein